MTVLELVPSALGDPCATLPFVSLLEVRGNNLFLSTRIMFRPSVFGAPGSRKLLRAYSVLIALRSSKWTEPLRLCIEPSRALRASISC